MYDQGGKNIQWGRTVYYLFIVCFFKDFIYLLERVRVSTGRREGGDGEGEEDALLSRDLMRDSIPGHWDHDLSQSQMLND